MISNEQLTLKKTVVQGTGNIVSDMGGEKVMLSVSKGKYYNLGEIGGEIWELIASPKEIQEIIHILLSNYQIDRSECEEQVLTFLEQLINEGLIEAYN